jgi:hypothetical protein
MTDTLEDESMPVGAGSVGLTGVAGYTPTTEKRKLNGKKLKKAFGKSYTYIKEKTITPLKAKLSEMAEERKQIKVIEKEAYKQARLEAKKSEMAERIEIAKQRGIKKAQWESKPLGEKIGAVTTRFKGMASKFGDMPTKMGTTFGTTQPMPRTRPMSKKESIFGTIKPMDLGLGFKPIDVGTGFKPIDLGGFKKHKKNKNKGIWI